MGRLCGYVALVARLQGEVIEKTVDNNAEVAGTAHGAFESASIDTKAHGVSSGSPLMSVR